MNDGAEAVFLRTSGHEPRDPMDQVIYKHIYYYSYMYTAMQSYNICFITLIYIYVYNYISVYQLYHNIIVYMFVFYHVLPGHAGQPGHRRPPDSSQACGKANETNKANNAHIIIMNQQHINKQTNKYINQQTNNKHTNNFLSGSWCGAWATRATRWRAAAWPSAGASARGSLYFIIICNDMI